MLTPLEPVYFSLRLQLHARYTDSRTRLRLAELDRRFDLLQTGLRDLIDHVLVDESADERFDPRWAESNQAQMQMQMRTRMARSSSTLGDKAGTVNEVRRQEGKPVRGFRLFSLACPLLLFIFDGLSRRRTGQADQVGARRTD